MNGKDMLEAMSFVDEKYIDDAQRSPRRLRWQPIAAAAACLALVVTAWQLAPGQAGDAAQNALPELAAAGEEDAAPADALPKIAVFGADVAASQRLPAEETAEITVTVLERTPQGLRCTVDDPGTGKLEAGQEITVELPEEVPELPRRLRITCTPTQSDATVRALSWAPAQ